MSDKLIGLKKLESEIAADKFLPLLQSNLVFGEGNPDCEVMFIGEAPGLNEDRLRRPFVGRGGQLLNEMMRVIGWNREDVYITNIVKRRPPENRDPLPEEIEAYKPYLTRQIAIINPKLIVTLGRFAMNYFLPAAKIMRDHGRVFTAGDYLVVPMLHPAAALRSPQQMMLLLKEDFKKLPGIIKGEFAPEIVVPALSIGPARKNSPEPEKPKQESLF
jgi:DNA polymerase